jgi:hypothetical protein
VAVLSSQAKAPPMMGQCETPSQAWSECKIRLGWLIELILEKAPDLFSLLASRTEKANKGQSAGTRAHAFESTLFMLGYDPSCFSPTDIAEADRTARRAKAVKAASANLPEDPAQYPHSTPTLTGTEADVHYRYANGEYDILWKTAKLRFSEELVEDVLDVMEQAGDEGILLAASQTGTPPEGSLGSLLKEAGYSPRAGSALAAILQDQNLIVSEGEERHSASSCANRCLKQSREEIRQQVCLRNSQELEEVLPPLELVHAEPPEDSDIICRHPDVHVTQISSPSRTEGLPHAPLSPYR